VPVDLGPRALAVYQQLRELIEGGTWSEGTKLSSVPALADEFGIASATMRRVQDRLEEEGFIRREIGVGTFVETPHAPAVLVVDDDQNTRIIVGEYIRHAGYRALVADDPSSALEILQEDHRIVLLLSDIRMPDTRSGIELIRTVRRRWPRLPVAAITGYPDDLAELNQSAECPALVILKPIQRSQIDDALRLIPPNASAADLNHGLPVLIADQDSELRTTVEALLRGAGYEVEQAATGDEVRAALRRRRFGHVLLDARLPGAGIHTAATLSAEHPATAVVLLASSPEDVIGKVPGPITLLTKPFEPRDVLHVLRLRVMS
jgi:CheY-like chemotaxis protein